MKYFISLIFALFYTVTNFSYGKVHFNEYKYDNDWTTNRAKVWSEYLSRYINKNKVRLLEIGVWEGRSAFWFLDNILTAKDSTYTGIEPNFHKNLKYNLKVTPHKEKMNIIEGKSGDVLKTLEVGSFDIIYIDGDHSAYAVAQDAILAWPLLKKGGVLIFDDYEMYSKKTVPDFELPKVAIDFFTYANRDEVEVLLKSYQVILRKREKPKEFGVFRIGENLYLSKTIYEKDPKKFFLFNRGKDEKKVRVSATEQEIKIIYEMLSKIPTNYTNFPKSLLKLKKYKTIADKFNLLIE